MKKLMLVYALAFIANWIWETLHSILYINYKGGLITDFILFRAALADAVIILVLIFIGQKLGRYKALFIATGGFIIAIIIEIWALQTGRWEYNSLMPIVPIIRTGLTPTIQLAITAYIVEKIVFGLKNQKIF